ncbi:MAG: glucosyl-3-phosphoglycerate synthase [Acidimicrobiales bacterium]
MTASRSYPARADRRPLGAPAPFDHRQFDPTSLSALKHDLKVSVCLPARNEAATIGAIVSLIQEGLVERVGLVDELIVVDDGSDDGTAEAAAAAGARTVLADDVLASHHTGPGKGQAMWKALFESTGDIVVFLDADVVNFGLHFVTGLVGPILSHPRTGMVKAFYQRPLNGRSDQGGRVTELVAKPLLELLFPHLGFLHQPLAGECAARRDVLERMAFAPGYGVEMALVIDFAAMYGVEALAQVDLGTRQHRNRTLKELSAQARTVMATSFARAGVDPAGVDRAGVARAGVDAVSRPRASAENLHVPHDLPALIGLASYRRRSA